MKHSISLNVDDKIEVWDDWGYPNGIRLGDTDLFLFGTDHIAQLRAALDELETKRAQAQRERAYAEARDDRAGDLDPEAPVPNAWLIVDEAGR